MGLLAGVSVFVSEMPPVGSVPLALLAVVEGMRQARRELSRPVRWLVAGAGVGATIDGRPVSE